MVEIKFECSVCKISPDELTSFSGYGNNPLKRQDNNEYCEKHFLEKERLYDECYESYRNLVEPTVSLEQYALTYTMASTV